MKKLKFTVLFTLVILMFTNVIAFSQMYNEKGVKILIHDKSGNMIKSISEGNVIDVEDIRYADDSGYTHPSKIFDKDGKQCAIVKNGLVIYKRNDLVDAIELELTVWEQVYYWARIVLFSIIILLFLKGTFVVTKQKTATIVERFGKFHSIKNAGLSLKLPLIDSCVSVVNLKIIELKVPVETITKNKVTVQVTTSIQYQIEDNSKIIETAHYAFADQRGQISSYVFDEVRAQVPKLDLDEVFEEKKKIADAVARALTESIGKFGISISTVLITEIDPDKGVTKAMNKINEQKRLRIAAGEEGEASKILIIKKAEADAESKRLQGKGIADQRREIASGLKDSLNKLKDTGIDEGEATNLMIITQHYDALTEIGANAKNNTLILPSSPTSGMEMMTQLMAANIINKEEIKDKKKKKK